MSNEEPVAATRLEMKTKKKERSRRSLNLPRGTIFVVAWKRGGKTTVALHRRRDGRKRGKIGAVEGWLVACMRGEKKLIRGLLLTYIHTCVQRGGKGKEKSQTSEQV